jgi:hypothetical protein
MPLTELTPVEAEERRYHRRSHRRFYTQMFFNSVLRKERKGCHIREQVQDVEDQETAIREDILSWPPSHPMPYYSSHGSRRAFQG